MSAGGLGLEGKVAFVTGSTRGIGWETARTLARHGATVVLNGHASQEIVDQRAAEVAGEFGTSCFGLLADAGDASAVKSCYAQIFTRFKRLDILVNNAGVMQEGLLGMIPEKAMRETLEVNVMGPILHLQEASRLMARNKNGSIVNVTSIMGRFGAEGLTVYSASKAALIGLTLSSAKELAPKNIRVNAVAPGFIDTDMTRNMPEKAHAQRLAGIKMNRIGTPGEVADAIAFLASDLARYVTGQILGVDGGMLV
jgi:3-oxoacyl-[acyl-carrier protein] reductase